MDEIDYKEALKALEASGKKILESLKDVAEDEKKDLLNAIKVVGEYEVMTRTGKLPNTFMTGRLLSARSVLARYEEFGLLTLRDWSEDFLKDATGVAAKMGKVLLGSFAASFGIPVHLG